jgi:hypothetical protein
MQAADPIDAYLRELNHRLRVRGRRRRRILAEVRAHLLDAAEAERLTGTEQAVAAQRAAARFGRAAENAGQFNALAARRGAVLRRTLVPWIAAVALTLMATATVWASRAGMVPLQQAPAHPSLRLRCSQRAGAFPAARGSGLNARRARLACGPVEASGR